LGDTGGGHENNSGTSVARVQKPSSASDVPCHLQHTLANLPEAISSAVLEQQHP
jgi:hypothetical protein